MAGVLVLAVMALVGSGASVAVDSPSGTPPTDLPLVFVPNAGQTDPSVEHMVRGPGHAFYFSPEKVVLDFERGGRGFALELGFRNADPHAAIVPERPTGGRFNYISGAERHTSLAMFRQLRYRNLWPGIDMVFRGQGGVLKYEFLVRAGADPGDIRLAYTGANDVSLGSSGGLLIDTPIGALRDSPPKTVQGGNTVDSRYVIGGSTYGFAVGSYDRSRPLTIDPGLEFSTFVGGLDFESAFDMDVDGAGNFYLTGQTRSASYPTTPGAHDLVVSGQYDGFVTKLDGAGQLVYSTYLGGSADETTTDIAIDGAGSAYLGGTTTSADFPTTTGAYDRTFTGSFRSFVTKLNQSGSALVYSTFLPGHLEGLALNAAGKAYVGGTVTTGNTFPVSAGAPDATIVSSEAFLARLNTSATALDWATYIGGRGAENVDEVDVDAAGEPYVLGRTDSIEEFPFTLGAFDTSNEGDNAFVTKMDASGTAFDYSTLLGTTSIVNPGLAVDGSGHAYVTGSGTVPTTPGAYDTTAEFGCSFATKINPTGTGLVYSTRLGRVCNATEIDVDPGGNAYIVAVSQGCCAPVTTPGAYDNVRNGVDAYVFKLSASGNGQLYGSFLGGTESDLPAAVAAVGSHSVAIAGSTDSSDFPTTPGVHDTTHNGSSDVFLTRLHAYEGYPRSKSATTLLFSLVNAYKSPTCNNRTHGPPLAHPSCSPPVPESPNATLGTPDANGKPARMEGYLKFRSVLGNRATPADEADLKIDFFLDDVFDATTMTDYPHQLRTLFTVRMTDRNSTDSVPATTQDYLFPLYANCTATVDELEGSTCALSTTAESIVGPGITEGKRSVWGIRDATVFDSGADGDARGLADNKIFARPGIFVP